MATRPRIVRAVIRPTTATGPSTRARIAGGDQAASRETEADEPVDPDFDEATYLRAFPDIAEAVRRGMLASGPDAFPQAGRAEMRLEKAEYRALLFEPMRGPGAATGRGRHADHLAVRFHADDRVER